MDKTELGFDNTEDGYVYDEEEKNLVEELKENLKEGWDY